MSHPQTDRRAQEIRLQLQGRGEASRQALATVRSDRHTRLRVPALRLVAPNAQQGSFTRRQRGLCGKLRIGITALNRMCRDCGMWNVRGSTTRTALGSAVLEERAWLVS
jgi:hypothetical protein